MTDLPCTSIVLGLCVLVVLAVGRENKRVLGWELFRKHGVRSVVFQMEERSSDPAETKRLRRAGTASWLAGGLVLAAIYPWMLGLP
jgi:hypothetical protein